MEYPSEVRLEVYDAIIRYAASGTLSELKPLAKMAFSFIKKEIDYNNARYEEMIAKRTESGKKGASVTNGKRQQESANSAKGGKRRQESANAADNDNVYDNVNDNDNENDIEEITPPLQSESCDSASERIDYNGLMELYNSTVGRSLSPIRLMTDARKKRVRTCIRQYGAQSVSEVFRIVQGSPFLLGHGKGGWKATFDWIFTPNNYVKILEGNYNEEPDRKETSGESLRTLARALMQGDVPGTDY